MTAKTCFAGLILMSATIATSVAVPLTYDIGAGSSVTVNTDSNNEPLIAVVYAERRSKQTFDFFKIWTDEKYVDADDWTPKSITAKLDFDVPDLDALVQGLTISGTLMGYSGGLVLWFDPILVDTGTRAFTVNLSEAYFDLGLNRNLGDTPAMITATVKQIRSGVGNIPVPDGGSTLMLLGAGIGAMLMVRRRSA